LPCKKRGLTRRDKCCHTHTGFLWVFRYPPPHIDTGTCMTSWPVMWSVSISDLPTSPVAPWVPGTMPFSPSLSGKECAYDYLYSSWVKIFYAFASALITFYNRFHSVMDCHLERGFFFLRNKKTLISCTLMHWKVKIVGGLLGYIFQYSKLILLG
jgi:hypothetical protein